MVETSPLLAWSTGRRILWGTPTSLLPLSPYLLTVVVFFLPCLLLLLLWHLAFPLAQLTGCGAVPIAMDLRCLRLGQAALEEEQNSTAQRELVGPILLILRVSGGPGVFKEQEGHWCTWEEILRATGSVGILAQARGRGSHGSTWCEKRGTSFSPSSLGPCRDFLL